jgi:hypothetical protein
LTDLLTGKGTLPQEEWAWEEMFAFVKAAQTPVRNPLLSTYWTMGAVRHDQYVAKLSVTPDAQSAAHAIHHDLDVNSGPDVFGPTLADELQAQAFDFDLQVQLCTDLEAMPLNDVIVEWPEKLSPFVTVGRVHLPRQDISAPENSDKGDALAFNQWRGTAEHRPLGEIMQVRRIYAASASVRRTLNHQPQIEPGSADRCCPHRGANWNANPRLADLSRHALERGTRLLLHAEKHSPMSRRKGSTDVSLACLHGRARADRTGALHTFSFVDRPESALAARGRDDKRRRFRPRLV